MAKTKEQAPAPAKAAPTPTAEREQPAPEKQPGRVQLARVRSASGGAQPGNGAGAPGDGPRTGAAGRARAAGQMQGAVGNARLGRANGGAVQAKLTVNAPGDVYEQEADRVADQVMRMPEGAKPALPPSIQLIPLGISRQPCPTCQQEMRRAEESGAPPRSDALCPECRQKVAGGRGMAQRAANGSAAAPEVTPEVEAGIQNARGGGSTLPPGVQRSMEDTMGADLGGVRVHTDGRADRLSRQLEARAFTSGQDIFFKQGEFNPQSREGRGLLAHEAAHTVQQGDSSLRLARTSGSKIQRSWLGDIASGIGGAAEWVGGQVAAGAEAAWEGTKWVGGKISEGAQWIGNEVQQIGAAAWGCAEALGRSAWEIVTLDIDSIYELLGIAEPTGGDPGTLGVIQQIIHHPCLMMIPGYSHLIDAVANLEPVMSFLKGAWQVIQDPSILIDALQESLGGLIAQVPDKAREWARRVITFSDPSTEHLEGIWRHLEPKLEYLAANWWDILKQTGWDLLWPWPGVWEDLQKIWDHTKSAASNIWDLNFSEAIDDLLAIWRLVNSALGRLYGWFFLASVLIGAIIGAFFGGAGAIPGAAAGASFAYAAGKFLLISTIAAETASIVKAGYDLVFGEQTEEEQEEDYEQIASSGLMLAIMGVMALASAVAVRFARGLAGRVRGLFRRGPRPTISSQKQAGHIRGTPQHRNRIKAGKPTSTFDGDQATVERLVQTAWERGRSVPGRPGVRDYDFGRRIGTNPNGRPQTRVRVHQDAQGRIHGHPVGVPSESGAAVGGVVGGTATDEIEDE